MIARRESAWEAHRINPRRARDLWWVHLKTIISGAGGPNAAEILAERGNRLGAFYTVSYLRPRSMGP